MDEYSLGVRGACVLRGVIGVVYYVSMSDRKPGKPLFELLSTERAETKGLGGTNDPEMGTKPKHTVELQAAEAAHAERAAEPETKPERAASAVNTNERAAALGHAPVPPTAAQGEHEIRLSSQRFYMILAAMLTLLVIVWATAFKMGVNSGKAQMEPLIDPEDVVMPRGPIAEGPSGGGAPVSSQAPTEPPGDVGARPRESVLSVSGDFVPDPRQSGHNYLQLGALPGAEARDAMSFFAAGGVTLIGVPLDSGRGGDNNTLRFMLFSTGLSVPSERYRAMAPEREQHKRVIASIGERWQRERRGGSDFAESKTLWVKYE